MKNILKNLKQFQNLKPFQIVIIVISIFFSVITFLAAPNLFNYKGFEKKLETKINSNFKIHIVNLKSIKYGFLPLPHFLIEQAAPFYS